MLETCWKRAGKWTSGRPWKAAVFALNNALIADVVGLGGSPWAQWGSVALGLARLFIAWPGWQGLTVTNVVQIFIHTSHTVQIK